MEGDNARNLFWHQKTRLITLSCGVKISAVYSFISVTKHACDRQMGRITIPKTALVQLLLAVKMTCPLYLVYLSVILVTHTLQSLLQCYLKVKHWNYMVCHNYQNPWVIVV